MGKIILNFDTSVIPGQTVSNIETQRVGDEIVSVALLFETGAELKFKGTGQIIGEYDVPNWTDFLSQNIKSFKWVYIMNRTDGTVSGCNIKNIPRSRVEDSKMHPNYLVYNRELVCIDDPMPAADHTKIIRNRDQH